MCLYFNTETPDKQASRVHSAHYCTDGQLDFRFKINSLALNAYLANSINSSQNRLSLRSSSPEATPPEIKSSLKLFSFSESFFNYVICKVFYLYNLTFLFYVSSAYIFISKIKMSNTRGQIISFHCLCSTVV